MAKKKEILYCLSEKSIIAVLITNDIKNNWILQVNNINCSLFISYIVL